MSKERNRFDMTDDEVDSLKDFKHDVTGLPWGRWLFRVLLVLGVVAIGFTALSFFAGTIKEAASVAQEEFGPRALLGKYEWFKDAQAQLAAKQASIEVLSSTIKPWEEAGVINLDRFQLDSYRQSKAEVQGLILSYNNLAAEYNAQHAKINWAFMDAGNVPAGSDPLARDFAQYATQ